MYRKKKIILGLFTFFCLSISLLFIIGKKTYSVNIETILKTSDYAYLSEAAKEYITQVYEETGEILLTEKNKEENVPYLNPEYVEYLDYVNSDNIDDEFSYDVIPSKTILDYVDNDITSYGDILIPTKFDLRNVDGKNFVTPLKDQESTGLCWAFATNANAESYLLVKNDTSYVAGTSQLFSEMQIDYALSSNGIIDSPSLYSYSRILGEGGRFNYAMDVMMDGLGLVDVSWRDFDTYDYVPMEKNDVYSYRNSKYEVISTVDYPRLNLSELDLSIASNVQKRENYLNNLKQLIMENGGAYVSTRDPVSRCAISVNGYRLMYDDDMCASGGHAMQIIGWDDDISYSFCSGQKDANNYYYLGNASNCTSGEVISGKGAWLIKNSWGTMQSYVYLAYDSMNTEINIITGMDVKEWDNHYNLKSSSSKIIEATYTKELGGVEKLSKVKFRVLKQNLDFNVCVGISNDDMNTCKDITANLPGIYTVDFSDNNILIDSNLKVRMTTSSTNAIDRLNIYTENIDNDIEIITEDSSYENKLTNIDKYIMRISSKTFNIPEGEKIDYKILNKDRNEITVDYTYEENWIFANQIFSKLLINKELSKGEYILQTIYNGNVLCESNLLIENDIVTIEGSGTEEDPYIINTPSQLNLIRLDRFAFYKLGQDIDLTYDTQNENGLFYNGGKGWKPINYAKGQKNSSYFLYFAKGFSGGFDGNNHKIIGLYINRPEEDGVGLFTDLYNENYSNLHIKNVSLVNPYVVGRDYVGGLVGVARGTTNERFLNINNVSIIGGYICGNNYVGGIIGVLNSGSGIKISGIERQTVANLYNSAFIDASNYGGGIFGIITNISGYTAGKAPVKISNVLNKGPVMSYGYTGGIAGYVLTRNSNSITIINAMNTGEIIGDIIGSNIVGKFDDKSVGELYLNNIYYLTDESMDFTNINVSNIQKLELDELKNINNYSLWDSFDTYWKIETIDGITRLPILKSIDFEYLSIDKIEVSVEKSVNIRNYINPQIDAALNNDYEIVDTSIANINEEGMISGLKSGNTSLKVISNYDGSIFDISINVNDVIVDSTINFESNGGSKVESITGKIGSEVKEQNAPVKENYSFAGWYLDNETFNNKYEFSVMPQEDITLYAKWEKIKKTIIFESNGGTEVEDITLDIGSELKEPNAPVKEGYRFAGWYLDNEIFINKYEFSVMPDKNIILYAKWEKLFIEIDNYDIEEDVILGIKVGTIIKDYLDNFKYDSRLNVKFYDDDGKLIEDLNAYVSTNSKIKFYDGDILISEYTNVVVGDVDGDGLLMLKDIMKLSRYVYVSRETLIDVYLLAGDYNRDDNYSLQDIMKMAYDLYIN